MEAFAIDFIISKLDKLRNIFTINSLTEIINRIQCLVKVYFHY